MTSKFLCAMCGWAIIIPALADRSAPPIASGPWSGAVTPTSAVIKAQMQVAAPASYCRLVYSTNAQWQPRITAEPAPDPQPTPTGRIATFRLTGLQPETRYFYALEVDGILALPQRGSFRTFPAGAASFAFAFASCAQTGSDHEVFRTIRRKDPLFFLNTGDFHYENIDRNDVAAFDRAYARVLQSPTQSFLYRHVPFVYIWDDHDFAGNDSDGTAAAGPAARRAYRKWVPHYPLPAGQVDGPVYQAFSVGRVRFILTDLRSQRDPSSAPDGPGKTMLGPVQKAWFKQEVLAARARHPLICWISSVPWNGEYGIKYYRLPEHFYGHAHHRWPAHRPGPGEKTSSGHQDHWSAYAWERREIADFLREHQVTGFCILHGDAHMLAADDGSHTDFATDGGMPIPLMAAAPLDRAPSVKGGPYSQGVYLRRSDEGCFGWVTVTDRGDRIDVAFSGRNHLNQEKIALQFSAPAP